MDDLKQVFHQIKLKVIASDEFCGAYLHAWDAEVYPLLHEDMDTELEQPLEVYDSIFDIPSSKVEVVLNYMNLAYLRKKALTFYGLEKVFGGQYDEQYGRGVLVDICRYLYLSDCFCESFWIGLLAEGKHPAEAGFLTRPFNKSEILLS
ncbi:hypothetical protein [Limnobaculum xujianqingii]|uniref:hypothetical protein n=1 Tax=Limnobaculum xujianqingii TaxID=2738837 RepID=UPI00112C2965|nr:hypothetical protein [Limnobaculum xujianqingii]